MSKEKNLVRDGDGCTQIEYFYNGRCQRVRESVYNEMGQIVRVFGYNKSNSCISYNKTYSEKGYDFRAEMIGNLTPPLLWADVPVPRDNVSSLNTSVFLNYFLRFGVNFNNKKEFCSDSVVLDESFMVNHGGQLHVIQSIELNRGGKINITLHGLTYDLRICSAVTSIVSGYSSFGVKIKEQIQRELGFKKSLEKKVSMGALSLVDQCKIVNLIKKKKHRVCSYMLGKLFSDEIFGVDLYEPDTAIKYLCRVPSFVFYNEDALECLLNATLNTAGYLCASFAVNALVMRDNALGKFLVKYLTTSLVKILNESSVTSRLVDNTRIDPYHKIAITLYRGNEFFNFTQGVKTKSTDDIQLKSARLVKPARLV